MITFNIHFPSVLLGFFIGYAVMAGIFVTISLDDRWSQGWNAGADARHMLEKLEKLVNKLKDRNE